MKLDLLDPILRSTIPPIAGQIQSFAVHVELRPYGQVGWYHWVSPNCQQESALDVKFGRPLPDGVSACLFGSLKIVKVYRRSGPNNFIQTTV